jgi:hypothetical protein
VDLFTDFKLAIQQDLTALGLTHNPNATVEDIVLLRYTHMRKTIAARQRAIHQSPEFQAALGARTQAEQQAMAAILAKFQRGDDVNGHLSERSVNPNIADGMLYDWDIYHLHVSNTKATPAQTFFDRVGPVALVKVTRTDAYFIDIRSHGQ